jgi:hypothetical protein
MDRPPAEAARAELVEVGPQPRESELLGEAVGRGITRRLEVLTVERRRAERVERPEESG